MQTTHLVPEFKSFDSIDAYTFGDLMLAATLDWDDDSSADCPTEWDPERVAVVTTSKPSRTIDLDHVPDGFALDEVRAEGEDVERAFRTHYARKQWRVRSRTLTGSCQGDWRDVVVACAPDGPDPDGLADALADWLFGDVYRVDVYAPYDNGRGVEWCHVGCVGGVYLTGMDSDARRACVRDVAEGVDVPDEGEFWFRSFDAASRVAPAAA